MRQLGGWLALAAAMWVASESDAQEETALEIEPAVVEAVRTGAAAFASQGGLGLEEDAARLVVQPREALLIFNAEEGATLVQLEVRRIDLVRYSLDVTVVRGTVARRSVEANGDGVASAVQTALSEAFGEAQPHESVIPIAPPAPSPDTQPPAPEPPATPTYVQPPREDVARVPLMDTELPDEEEQAQEGTAAVFGSIALGVTGPFGGNTLPSLSEGFSGAAALGYAFSQHFGVALTGLWYSAAFALSESDGGYYYYRWTADNVTENGGSFLLGGLELLGRVGGDSFLGWASAGLAFGGGAVDIELERGDKATYEFDFDMSPVLGFGAEARVSDVVWLGMQARWYLISLDRLCVDVESDGYDDGRECLDSVDDEEFPHFVFVGLTLAFHAN